jgi:integrase/recombinase XerD
VGSPERIRSATTHMDRGSAQAAMKAVVQQCGIKKSLGSHASPHSFTAHLLEKGLSLRHIQTLLGHSTPTTTARYAHLTDITEHSHGLRMVLALTSKQEDMKLENTRNL